MKEVYSKAQISCWLFWQRGLCSRYLLHYWCPDAQHPSDPGIGCGSKHCKLPAQLCGLWSQCHPPQRCSHITAPVGAGGLTALELFHYAKENPFLTSTVWEGPNGTMTVTSKKSTKSDWHQINWNGYIYHSFLRAFFVCVTSHKDAKHQWQ